MKKVSWIVVIAGAVVGLAAVVLTHLGNPANMGFCIACFLRDITGAVGMHGAAKVQYVRPEIIGLVLGASSCPWPPRSSGPRQAPPPPHASCWAPSS